MKGQLTDILSGILPWIAFSIFLLQGMITVACLSAAAVMLLTLLLSGNRPGVIDTGASCFFLIAGCTGLIFGNTWLAPKLGVLANFTLMSFVLVSIIRRQPFTLRYARRHAPKEVWDHLHFYRVNYIISGFWCLAFLFGALLALKLGTNPGKLNISPNLAPVFSLVPAVLFTICLPPLYKKFIYSFDDVLKP